MGWSRRYPCCLAQRSRKLQQLLSTYWSAVTDAPLAVYRGPGSEVATEKINGLRDRYDVDDARTLSFFTVHSTLDIEHSGADATMIASLALSRGR